MTSKKTNKTVVADPTPATTLQIETPSQDKAVENKELVLSAKITTPNTSSTETIINRSQNFVCLYANPRLEITLAPREIKSVPKDDLRELLKNPMVRRFFDKGIISHNTKEDDKVVSAHDAVAPDNLSQAVERHDGGHVVAEVKKFQKDGEISIEL